jgi:hypothetical protein
MFCRFLRNDCFLDPVNFFPETIFSTLIYIYIYIYIYVNLSFCMFLLNIYINALDDFLENDAPAL